MSPSVAHLLHFYGVAVPLYREICAGSISDAAVRHELRLFFLIVICEKGAVVLSGQFNKTLGKPGYRGESLAICPLCASAYHRAGDTYNGYVVPTRDLTEWSIVRRIFDLIGALPYVSRVYEMVIEIKDYDLVSARYHVTGSNQFGVRQYLPA